MLYYSTPIDRSPDSGTRPDVPDIPILWVLYAADFVIIETTVWLAEGEGIVKIRGDLEALLASTVAYPPARALACRGLEDSELSWPEFAHHLEQRLRHYIETQATSGFRLLRCLKDQGASLEMGGYGGVDRYYWVLAANKETVDWVGEQTYEVHWAHIGEFEIPADCVLPSELPGPVCPFERCGRILAQTPVVQTHPSAEVNTRGPYHNGALSWPRARQWEWPAWAERSNSARLCTL